MEYEYWYANIKGISNRRKTEIRQQFVDIKELFFAEESKMETMGLSQKERKGVIESIQTWKLNEEYEKILKENIQCIPIWHSMYPKNLKEIHTAPYMLYVNGQVPNSRKKTVAIVGARDCSTYGSYMARQFAEKLALEGIQIVSGMARGIDSISQRAALEAGGMSFAVLGCGADVCYPKEEKFLFEALKKQGGIISELPMGTPPFKSNFPARNRIISGLADAILVIEAKERSGSLITVDMALEQGKDVYALPGPVNSKLSYGCNSLIKQGAEIVLSTEDLLNDLGIDVMQNSQNRSVEKILLETTEKLVYSCLDLQPQNLGDLIQRTKLSVPELLDVLIRLEMMGIVGEISKNHYVKLK